MAKDKEKKTNAMRMVERAKVPYNVYHYAWKEDALDAVHAAAELQRPTDQVFKTLVAIGDKTGPVVGVIPSDQELDLKYSPAPAATNVLKCCISRIWKKPLAIFAVAARRSA